MAVIQVSGQLWRELQNPDKDLLLPNKIEHVDWDADRGLDIIRVYTKIPGFKKDEFAMPKLDMGIRQTLGTQNRAIL